MDIISFPWYKDDPRYQINKRATIVVLYTGLNGRLSTSIASVETKHGWAIYFEHRSPDNFPADIGENDNWQGWFWTFAPREELK